MCILNTCSIRLEAGSRATAHMHGAIDFPAPTYQVHCYDYHIHIKDSGMRCMTIIYSTHLLRAGNETKFCGVH